MGKRQWILYEQGSQEVGELAAGLYIAASGPN